MNWNVFGRTYKKHNLSSIFYSFDYKNLFSVTLFCNYLNNSISNVLILLWIQTKCILLHVFNMDHSRHPLLSLFLFYIPHFIYLKICIQYMLWLSNCFKYHYWIIIIINKTNLKLVLLIYHYTMLFQNPSHLACLPCALKLSLWFISIMHIFLVFIKKKHIYSPYIF